MGYELGRLQMGGTPTDFKPIRSVGPGVYEVRVGAEGHAFRAFYVAQFEEALYVLHAFEKKTRTTATRDLEIGRTRYESLLQARAES